MRYNFDFDPDATAKRLSPAARETLNELVDTYRVRLLESVYESAPEGEVSATDLLRSSVQGRSYDVETEQVRFAAQDAYRARRDQYVLIMASLLALIAAVSVAVFGLAPLFGFSADSPLGTPLTIAIAAAGLVSAYGTLLVAMASRFRLRRQARDFEFRYNYAKAPVESVEVSAGKSTNRYERTGVYLAGWRVVEELIYRLGREKLGVDPSQHMALSSVVVALAKDGTLTPSAAEEARYAVQLRNKLVHGDNSVSVSDRDIERLAQLANALKVTEEFGS